MQAHRASDSPRRGRRGWGAYLPDRLGSSLPASAQIGLRRRTPLTPGTVLHPKSAAKQRYKRRVSLFRDSAAFGRASNVAQEGQHVAQTCFSRSAAFLTDRAQRPRTYKTGPRYSLQSISGVYYRHETCKSCARPRVAGSSNPRAGSENLLCRGQPRPGGAPPPSQDSESTSVLWARALAGGPAGDARG
jgi:hypothetical protein